MQQHGSKYFLQTRQPLGLGHKVEIQPFSEYGHVACQIKWNPKCSNMVAKTLPADPPILRVGSKGQNLLSLEYGHVAYKIKGNEAICYSQNTPMILGVGPNGQNTTLFRIWSCCISN